MAIYIIDGYAGNGKTAYAINWAVQKLKEGERIFSDIKINSENIKTWKLDFKFPYLHRISALPENCEGLIQNKADRENPDKRILYWQNFEDLALMDSGTILCDDAGVKFNSRNYANLPDDVQKKIQTHRHDKLDIILTTPHWSRVDVIIRQMAERIIHCQLLIGSQKFKKSIIPRISMVTDHHLEDMTRAENMGIASESLTAISKEFFWISETVMNLYDTGAKIMESKPSNFVHKLRICPECDFEKVVHS